MPQTWNFRPTDAVAGVDAANRNGGICMPYYHAEIINLSLKDITMIKDFSVLNVKKRFLGYVKIYTISVPETDIEKTIFMFQKNLCTKLKKEWYITFHNDKRVIVVFRDRLFDLSGKGLFPIYQKKLDTMHAEEKQKWDELIEYAKTLGIPDQQCDFLPENFASDVYTFR